MDSNSSENRPPRIFFLGAGFSAPAGLPVAQKLLGLVLSELDLVGTGVHLRDALKQYRQYAKAMGRPPDAGVDIEDFGAYLDYEHTFGMLGSDTWSKEGNRAQLELRWGIGRVLHRHTPGIDSLPRCYVRFAESLRPRDLIVTFNYDTLLEMALEKVGMPHRRFPTRYSEIGLYSSTTDYEAEGKEVLILKVHGSLDWVSMKSYREENERYVRDGRPDALTANIERDMLFGAKSVSPTHRLLEGPAPDDDPLADVYVIEDLQSYYTRRTVLYYHPPLILAPSVMKQAYGESLRGFWSGLPIFGWTWGGLSIIGYSLPAADPYARQVMYRLVRGYMKGLKDPRYRLGGATARPMQIVDLRRKGKQERALRKAYGFMKPKYTEYHLGGFDEDAVRRLFSR